MCVSVITKGSINKPMQTALLLPMPLYYFFINVEHHRDLA